LIALADQEQLMAKRLAPERPARLVVALDNGPKIPDGDG
jgi:hypothetical protein